MTINLNSAVCIIEVMFFCIIAGLESDCQREYRILRNVDCIRIILILVRCDLF